MTEIKVTSPLLPKQEDLNKMISEIWANEWLTKLHSVCIFHH